MSVLFASNPARWKWRLWQDSSTKKGKSVSSTDFDLNWNLGVKDKGFWVAWSPLILATTLASAVYYKLPAWNGLLCVLTFIVTFLAVFVFHLQADREMPNGRTALTKGHWLFGDVAVLAQNKHRIPEWILESVNKYGNGFCLRATGHTNAYIYIDPATIRHLYRDNFDNYVKGFLQHRTLIPVLGHGIFNVDGKLWRTQRKAASHLFTMRFLRDHMTSVFEKGARELVELLSSFKAGEKFDLQDIFFRFTLDAFVEIAFGVKLHCITRYPQPVPFAVAFDAAQRGVFLRFMNPLWRLDGILGREPEKSLTQHIEIMNEFAVNIIRERRAVKDLDERPDLLSRFIASARKNGDSEELLSDEYLRDLVINFVIAGRDTTAQTLSWLFYQLSRHPDVEQRMLSEACELLPHTDSAPDYRVLNEMTFSHAAVSETLRLHPPVPSNLKMCLNDDVLPDGTNVKAGDVVAVSTWAMGRNEDVWGEDCREFKPSRFLDEEGKFVNYDQFKFFSFNGGARLCLGKPAAYLEAKMAAAMLLRKFKVHVYDKDVAYDMSLTLPIKNGLTVSVEER